MRTLRATLGLLVVVLVLAPIQAHAWWSWLDDLSGPGKFNGPQFEFRIVCFGAESEAKRLLADLERAQALTRTLTTQVRQDPLRLSSALVTDTTEAWSRLGVELKTIQQTFPVLDSKAVADTSTAISNRFLTSITPILLAARSHEGLLPSGAGVAPSPGILPLPGFPSRPQLPSSSGLSQTPENRLLAQAFFAQETLLRQMPILAPYIKVTPMTGKKVADDLDLFGKDTNILQVKDFIRVLARGISAISSTGVVFSACSTDVKRRSSIEVSANFWHTNGTADFAASKKIKLTTVMPMFSFRVFNDPRFDVMDTGVGGGVYWFTSEGFDSFSGVILQPLRLDLHVPTLWSSYKLKSSKWWARVLAVPTFRYSLMTFPAGFAADAFAGVGAHNVRIPAELNKSWGFFLNLEPFGRKDPVDKKTKVP